MASPAPVSASFCVPHETQLVVEREQERESWFPKREFTIKDSKGILLFNIVSMFERVDHSKRRICDSSSGKLLRSLKNDVRHEQWLAFHGDSESHSELCFTLRRKSEIRLSCVVFLPENSDYASPDFSIKYNGFWSSSFTIFSRGTPIAEAKKNGWLSSTFTVTVYPEVDRAFVAGLVLIWILESQGRQGQQRRPFGGAGAHGAHGAGSTFGSRSTFGAGSTFGDVRHMEHVRHMEQDRL